MIKDSAFRVRKAIPLSPWFLKSANYFIFYDSYIQEALLIFRFKRAQLEKEAENCCHNMKQHRLTVQDSTYVITTCNTSSLACSQSVNCTPSKLLHKILD